LLPQPITNSRQPETGLPALKTNPATGQPKSAEPDGRLKIAACKLQMFGHG
jgi:hypothetical protein